MRLSSQGWCRWWPMLFDTMNKNDDKEKEGEWKCIWMSTARRRIQWAVVFFFFFCFFVVVVHLENTCAAESYRMNEKGSENQHYLIFRSIDWWNANAISPLIYIHSYEMELMGRHFIRNWNYRVSFIMISATNYGVELPYMPTRGLGCLNTA